MVLSTTVHAQGVSCRRFPPYARYGRSALSRSSRKRVAEDEILGYDEHGLPR
jgi:hypothetical protein